jgi:polyisoprenoid-binding protein YceI
MPGIRWAAVLAGLALPSLLPGQELTPGTEYRVDAARSEIAWELPASLRGVRSRTRELSGTARVVQAGEDGVLLEGRLEIDAASFETGSTRRDRTLREESLAAGEHPRIVFSPHRIFRISSWAEDEAFAIEGDLSIRGVTQPVRIPVSLARRGQRLLVDGRTSLKWADYGVPDPSSFLYHVRPEVQITAHLELVPRP